MEALLLIDFGSTNTKVTAVDPAAGRLLGTAAAFTTVKSDVGEGLEEALALLEKECGNVRFARRYACSSAAGGLRVVACGLVPGLTAKAARLASLGAGAKVVKVFTYELTDEDVAEIAAINPDILLLAGGVDGGNKEVIIHNAEALAAMPETKTDAAGNGEAAGRFPILLAGNRAAASACERILAGRDVIRCPNVLPQLGTLDIEPVQSRIRELFLRRIIHAKGLSRESALVSGILMPTPSAVKKAAELLASGGQGRKGIGELAAVDLGGATTDVYSVAKGLPQTPNTIMKGLPEPFSKRSVEGDIGMRYSASGVLDAVGAERLAELSGLSEDAVRSAIGRLRPEDLPVTAEDEALDFALASAAAETAVSRHAGTIEEVYTSAGPFPVQTGKDLTGVENLVFTGGALVRNPRLPEIAECARYNAANPSSLRPLGKKVFADRLYILAAMGLLSDDYPETALSIMLKEIHLYGT